MNSKHLNLKEISQKIIRIAIVMQIMNIFFEAKIGEKTQKAS